MKTEHKGDSSSFLLDSFIFHILVVNLLNLSHILSVLWIYTPETGGIVK